MVGWSGQRAYGRQLMRVERTILYPTADNLRFIPRLMYALMHSTRRELAGVLGEAQPMPVTWLKTPLQVIVREDEDRDITVHLIGQVRQTNGLEVQAMGPDGALISRTTVPAGRHASFAITLPKDGKTGAYVLFVNRVQGDQLSLPLTTLPEVFLISGWSTEPGGTHQAQYFTRSPGAEPCEIALGGEASRLFSADHRTLLGFTSKAKQSEVVRVGPDGGWICAGTSRNAYVKDGSPAVVSVSPERWFQPDPAALAIKPVP
jgi:hypothetical protein